MSKRKATPATKAVEEDKSKLDGLVQAEEQIVEEVEAADDKTTEETAKTSTDAAASKKAPTTSSKKPDVSGDDESSDAPANKSRTVDIPVEPVVWDEEPETKNREKNLVVESGDDKEATVLAEAEYTDPTILGNIVDSEADVYLHESRVDSGVETQAVKLQYAENADVSDEQIARVAEIEAADMSAKTNHTLPNGPNPESINPTVKVNSMITRATNFDPEHNPAFVENQNIAQGRAGGIGAEGSLVQTSAMKHKQLLVDAKGNSTSSTETLQLDEIAIPVESRRPTRMEQQILRQSRSANPVLRDNSSEPIIAKTRPVNIFQAVAQAKTLDGQTVKNYMVSGATDMREHLEQTVGISQDKLNDGSFLSTLVDSLDEYTKAMSPNAPKTAETVSEQQAVLIGVLNATLDQDVDVGVTGLQIVEEYFKVYRNAAFRGDLPFRAFNEFSPEENRLSNLIYTIQEIANTNRKEALGQVSIKKLKDSIDSETGQLIIVSYLRRG